MKPRKHRTPFVLLILDGYGLNPLTEGNAIAQAQPVHMSRYMREYPCVSLHAAGIEVGLPWGEMGNSETGHQNIGSGQILYQPLPRISLSIQNGSFFTNTVFLAAIDRIKQRPDAALHTVGMPSDGGVHSHIDHQMALIDFAKQQGVGDRLFVHAFLDGRDSPPDQADNYINQVVQKMRDVGSGRLASMVGRYYAMDRNQNWDRTQAAYDLLVYGKGQPFESWQAGLKQVFNETQRRSFEFAPPVVMTENNKPIRLIADGDTVLMYNFREDRSVQLAEAFTKPDFDEFPVMHWKDLQVITMTPYGKSVRAIPAFQKQEVGSPVGKVFSDHGLKQLRIAESEKFAHVTYFFNGGKEEASIGEDWVAVPSLNVKEYNQHPEMSARAITNRILDEIERGAYDVIIANYANPDMVAHTGDFEAIVQAIQLVDSEIGRVVEAALKKEGTIMITGDHGNAEETKNVITGEEATDHTTHPVPFLYITRAKKLARVRTDDEVMQLILNPVGILADVAPTILEVLGLPKPGTMTAESLLPTLLAD